jgi:hypothetical protein
MNLPLHGRTSCLGIDGSRCDRPIDRDSLFPFCQTCLAELRSRPQARLCAGAIIYDGAMRLVRIKCERDLLPNEQRLCRSCLDAEALRQSTEACPHCGQRMPASSSSSPSRDASREAPTGLHGRMELQERRPQQGRSSEPRQDFGRQAAYRQGYVPRFPRDDE